jgi:hypothetical protein
MYVGWYGYVFENLKFCVSFSQFTFTLLSKFTLLSHIAQSNIKVY